MKAVATTVMNRVHVAYGQYLREGQGDLRRIIEAPYEFTCLLTQIGGQPNPQTVWSSPPEQIHYDIADWALSGHKHWGAGESLWYMNPFAIACPPYFPYNRSGVQYNRVNEHCFFIPTALYAQT